MFHSLKCHWESGCTFIKRVCHFRTRFVILYLTSSLTEVSGCNPDSEIVKSSQWAHVFSRSCGLVSHPASQGKCWRARIWYCGSILISGVYLPKFLWSCTWAVLSLSPLAQVVYAVTSENPLIAGAYFPSWEVKNESHRLFWFFFISWNIYSILINPKPEILQLCVCFDPKKQKQFLFGMIMKTLK